MIYANEWQSRIWEKTSPEPNTGCWLWTGAVGSSGYGRVQWKDAGITSAPQAALVASGRPRPAGAFALHACDNKICINPAHLRWGSCSDNARDTYARERRLPPRKEARVCHAAVEVLRETNNPAVMWGDTVLLHQIAERAGIKHNGWVTETRVLNALSARPGILVPGFTYTGRGRRVRIFRLLEGK